MGGPVAAVCRDKLSTAETLVLVLGGKVHVDPDQGSTLHKQGVPEAELGNVHQFILV